MKARRLSPELLDSLPASDPAAQASRRDLQRLHPLLGQISLWTRWFSENFPVRPPASLADLGAGDGYLLLRVLLRSYPRGGQGARIFFVDRQPCVPEATLTQLQRSNWLPTVVPAELPAWLEESPPLDAVITNLFLHHFGDAELRTLFSTIATKTTLFAAAEPQRNWISRWGAHGLGLLGCHPVTRHDARVSVEAGFTRRELSTLWPSSGPWKLHEQAYGPFTHFFCARLGT